MKVNLEIFIKTFYGLRREKGLLYRPLQFLVFFTSSDILLLSRRIKKSPRAIDEELRGWNWNEPPIYSQHFSQTSVSELIYCTTLRNLYLRQKGYKVGEESSLIKKRPRQN